MGVVNTFGRYLSRGLLNFKIENTRPLFTVIFKFKNINFKNRDFNPLIERVLVGVKSAKVGLFTILIIIFSPLLTDFHVTNEKNPPLPPFLLFFCNK